MLARFMRKHALNGITTNFLCWNALMHGCNLNSSFSQLSDNYSKGKTLQPYKHAYIAFLILLGQCCGKVPYELHAFAVCVPLSRYHHHQNIHLCCMFTIFVRFSRYPFFAYVVSTRTLVVTHQTHYFPFNDVYEYSTSDLYHIHVTPSKTGSVNHYIQ